MVLLKLLIAINLAAWFLPAFVFRKDKYRYYFIIKSLIDPLYIILSATLKLEMYNYITIALLFELAAFPLIDSRFRTISATALLFLSLTARQDGYLELIVCESVLSMLIYSLLKDASIEIDTKSSVKIFQILLLLYFIRNGMMFYLYYCNHSVLDEYYYLLLIPIVILPIIIAYYGPDKKIVLGRKNFLSNSVLTLFRPEAANDECADIWRNNGLTSREYDIIRLVGRGYTNREIAEKLFLSKSSIDHSRVIIKEKLHISKRSEYISFIENNHQNQDENNRATML